MSDKFYKYYLPDGRIFHVEVALKAINREGITSVALKGKTCAVVASQNIATNIANIDPETATSLFALNEIVGCVVTGRYGDCKYLVQEARREASDFHSYCRHQMAIDVLCHRMADNLQLKTRCLEARALACSMMLISYDDDLGASVFKTDPSANYCGYFACASGAKQLQAEDFLRKNYKLNMSEKESVRLAVNCLENVSEFECQPQDIEVGIVTDCNRQFRKLNEKEIKEYKHYF
ncbi:proteasome subunit alpha type-6-like [Drosophila nasuta]|uniref:proteasome subunit alpha type-6-like n=1 Tax=Drosophila nasuta TaxID=42062 RepID=UPI00295E929F|nr:proteasome subunit alpha type-6-like [Drosophila nasuta]